MNAPETIHQAHVRLGFRSGNCAACQNPEPPQPFVPEWVKRAQASRLPVRITGGSAA